MMLAYAASRRRDLADRHPHPNMMLLIIGAHVAALAAVMSAKLELPHHLGPVITKVDLIPAPKPPPTHPIRTLHPLPPPEGMSHPLSRLPIPLSQPVRTAVPLIDPGLIASTGASVTTAIGRPIATPVRTGPWLLTPPSELKPPYPAMKLLNEEEGEVTVRLTIDEQGRVIAVDPVGRTDSAFLDAARRHLLTHWRFAPASEDGRAVRSTTTVTLHFELNG